MGQSHVRRVHPDVSSEQMSKPAPSRNVPVTVKIATKAAGAKALFPGECLHYFAENRWPYV